MENKKVLWIVGGLAALLGIYFITSRRSVVTSPAQYGKVGTAPGPDTTPQELAFKSNVFSTYADYLKSIAAGEQATIRVKEQSALEQARISAGVATTQSREDALTRRQELAESGQSERARIFADADVANAGQRSAAELERLRLADQFARMQAGRQQTGNVLDAITRALGNLFGGQSRGGGGAGSGGGSGGVFGTPPTFPRGLFGGAPRPNITPSFFDPRYQPAFPEFDPNDPRFGFGIDDFFNPFADYYDPFSNPQSGDIYSGFPELTPEGWDWFGNPFDYYDNPVGGFGGGGYLPPDYAPGFDGGYGDYFGSDFFGDYAA